MPKKYDLVLLDLDGTVADTDEMILRTMNDLYDKYRDGRRTPPEEVYYFSGPPIKVSLEKEFPGVDINLLMKEFADISWDYYDICVTTYPHVIETLTKLKSEGVYLGIVTSKGHNNTIKCLESLHLNELIDVFVAGDDVKETKPNPEGIYLLMEHFAIKDKKKVLYIGDNKGDYLTARNAGVDVGLVTWGPRKIDYSLSPEYWIDDFKEVEEIINE